MANIAGYLLSGVAALTVIWASPLSMGQIEQFLVLKFQAVVI